MKIHCSSCREVKDESHFGYRTGAQYRGKYKRKRQCRACENEKARIRNQARCSVDRRRKENWGMYLPAGMEVQRQRHAKVTYEDVELMRALRELGLPVKDIAEKFEIAPSTVYKATNFRSWTLPPQGATF